MLKNKNKKSAVFIQADLFIMSILKLEVNELGSGELSKNDKDKNNRVVKSPPEPERLSGKPASQVMLPLEQLNNQQ